MGFLDTLRGRTVTARPPVPDLQVLSPDDRQEREWRSDIARLEWLALHVAARDDGSPAYQYTAGLTERGLPEMVVYGLRMKTGVLVLDDLAGRLLDGHEFPDGVSVPDLVHGHDQAQLWDATWLQDPLDAVLRLYGTQARVRQLVVSDAAGRLPWEGDFLTPHLQPVLFVPPNGRGPRRAGPPPG